MQNQKTELKKSFSQKTKKKIILSGSALILALLVWILVSYFLKSELEKKEHNSFSHAMDRQLDSAPSSQQRKNEGNLKENNSLIQKKTWSASTQKKIETLHEIFKSKNDNDPRLDTDFKKLSEEDKLALREEYKKLPSESLNERGTLVFLLGRNIQTQDDILFFDSVLSESICMSLEDCKKDAQVAVFEEHTHLESADNVTLAYPQLVALNMYERMLKSKEPLKPFMRETIEKSLISAQESHHLVIQKKAESLIKLIKKNK